MTRVLIRDTRRKAEGHLNTEAKIHEMLMVLCSVLCGSLEGRGLGENGYTYMYG